MAGDAIRAVLFDYGLTLVHFERPVEAIEAAQDAIAQCIEAAGHPRLPASLLRTAVHDRVEAEVSAHDASGALEEIDVAAVEERAFSDIGLELDAALRDRCSGLAQKAWCNGVTLYPDATATLRALRDGGLRVGICSNASYRATSMHEQLHHTGLDELIDAAVFSSEVGWRKPSPRLFAAALASLGASAEHTVFVGDRMREDIGGAAHAGMRTVLVARDQSDVHAQQPDRADAMIRSLSELPALLLGNAVVTIVGAEN